MHEFGKPKHSVYFLVFQWDKGISKKNHKKLFRGAIRLPIIFLRLNTMLKGKKQRKFTLLMKLAISNFRCPGETHITDFTRLPPLCIFVKQKYSHWHSFVSIPHFLYSWKPMCAIFTGDLIRGAIPVSAAYLIFFLLIIRCCFRRCFSASPPPPREKVEK